MLSTLIPHADTQEPLGNPHSSAENEDRRVHCSFRGGGCSEDTKRAGLGGERDKGKKEETPQAERFGWSTECPKRNEGKSGADYSKAAPRASPIVDALARARLRRKCLRQLLGSTSLPRTSYTPEELEAAEHLYVLPWLGKG